MRAWLYTLTHRGMSENVACQSLGDSKRQMLAGTHCESI
eukprot:SAG31_NODE_434_length_15737_cov_10.315450_3_plen_39_part_00